MTNNEEHKKTATEGYNHLVREALCKRIDILRENIYQKYHKKRRDTFRKERNILPEERDHGWFDPQVYNNFYFVSGHCNNYKGGNDMICSFFHI